MSAGAPWSVKGIDAKAREVAKDLARRSGMTLGEWLNQMILEGEDVGAMIARERAKEAPAREPVREAPRESAREPVREAYHERVTARPAPRRVPEADFYDEADDDYDRFAPRSQRAQAYRDEPVEAPRAARRAPPFSSASQPLGRPMASHDLRRRSIFEDRPRYDDGYEPEPAPAPQSNDLGRVARALETLGSRIETSETRSAGAVRGVSHAVETLLARLERSEAAHAETQGKLDEQSQEVLSSFERLSRTEEDQQAIAGRIEQAERLIDAQAERLEGLSGHLREERERIAKVEQAVKSPQAIETVRAVEGALGKLANQLYEGDVRIRETVKDVREDMVGLSHRLAQVELRDPERAAQIVIDKVVAKMAQRLEAAEAQTSGAIRNLEQAFKLLEGRLNHAEERGDVHDPEAVRSLSGLAADLSRRVETSRAELLEAMKSGTADSVEKAVKAFNERIDQSEKRSAGAIEKMGQDVMRVADSLNRRLGGVETASRDGLARLDNDSRDNRDNLARVTADVRRVAETVEAVSQSVTQTIDGRVGRVESSHAQALERLGGEIARISERLGVKLSESERRTTQVLSAIGEQFEAQRDHTRDDLTQRIRQSEERTQKMLEEARARIDQKLAQVQTQTLLAEAVKPARVESQELPNPFGHVAVAKAPAPAPVSAPPVADIERTPFSKFSGGFDDEPAKAQLRNPPGAIDLTGHLLQSVTDFKPEFDPFEDGDMDDELVSEELVPELEPQAFAGHVGPAASEPSAYDDQDDSDPFADIDVSRKTAPRGQEARPAASFAASRPQRDVSMTLPMPGEPVQSSRSPFDEDDVAVSVSTRDALAAARAAVRASMEPPVDDTNVLGGLRSGASRSRGVQPKPAKAAQGGAGASKVAGATAVAIVATALVVGGAVGLNALMQKSALDKGKSDGNVPIAAAVVVPDAAEELDNQQDLKTRYDLAVNALNAKSPKAIDLLKQVANQGYAPAQYSLSRVYLGEGGLVPANNVEARKWTQRAAEGGLPGAMHILGSMYYGGDGGTQDRSMAAMWFRKAAERGVKDSQFNLGVLYERGDGVPINPSEAYKWLSIAADAGDKGAKVEVDKLKTQLSEAQLQKAEDAVSRFTPISDGQPPMAASASQG